jgi:glycosyltransferase involved in cell wall biosynthesis
MRVALVITELEVGGAERAMVELATRLDRGRYQPAVYCLAGRPKPGADRCVVDLEKVGIEVDFFGARGVWSFPAAMAWLRRRLMEMPPEVVQTFLFHANILGRTAARLVGRPTVLSGIRVAEHRRWGRLAIDRWTEAWVARHVCVSQAVADFSRTQGHLTADKLVVIPNGIDLAQDPASPPANLAAFGVPAGRRVVTFVGRFDMQKGVDWLVAHAPKWLEPLPDVDLLLVGKGPEEKRLRWLASVQGISSRVHFAGWRGDVAEILAASCLLVLPSRWEGMPNVVIEAMASRLPVLATDVEGVRELLGPDAESQTVVPQDSQSFADKLVTLASSPPLAQRLGQQNRRRVESEFSITRTVRAYQDLWESLAHSKD